MYTRSGDPLSERYRRVLRNDVGELSLDGQMLAVFMESDGEKTLRQVADKTGMDPRAAVAAVAKLTDLQLVEPVAQVVAAVGEVFVRDLIAEFSLAIGPIADVVVEDTVLDLGYDLASFPANRAAELVELLAQELQRESDRLTFKKNMLERIKTAGY